MKKGEKFNRVKILKKEYNELKKIEDDVESTKVYKRVQAFKLIHKKWRYSAIAEFLNISKETMSGWINIYKKEGTTGLLTLHYKGGQPKLNKKQITELKEKAGQGQFTFAKDVKHYIEENFGIKYNLKHVQLLSKKNFIYPLRKPKELLQNPLV